MSEFSKRLSCERCNTQLLPVFHNGRIVKGYPRWECRRCFHFIMSDGARGVSVSSSRIDRSMRNDGVRYDDVIGKLLIEKELGINGI